ncbi:hypothetical protein Tco_0404389 [Tanacetum coccineum]
MFYHLKQSGTIPLRITLPSNAVQEREVEADLSNMETKIQEEPKKISEALKDSRWWLRPIDKMVLKNKKIKGNSPLKQGQTVGSRTYSVERLLMNEGVGDAALLVSRSLVSTQRLKVVRAMYVTSPSTPEPGSTKEIFLHRQEYVDDIIFGSSNPKLCREFEALMHDKFKLSAMGELSFFLGQQTLPWIERILRKRKNWKRCGCFHFV